MVSFIFDCSPSYILDRVSGLYSKLADSFGLASLDPLPLSSVAAITDLSLCPPSIYVGSQVFIITVELSPGLEYCSDHDSWLLYMIRESIRSED